MPPIQENLGCSEEFLENETQTCDPGLSIQIPKSSTPTELGLLSQVSNLTPDADPSVPTKKYRQKLSEKLGSKYQGTEKYRLEQDEKRERHWKRWGPYLSDRQWATVREDYSDNGDAWRYFPHEHARSRTYRWGEDGIGGISDDHQRLCFSLAFWNEQDPILKERLFGVTNPQGNHGEDVKELYYYLDCSPTHSYMKFLYKYPQCRYPYEELVIENAQRDRNATEYEVLDSGVFDDDRYWDIFIEYAKGDDPNDVYVRIEAYNRGSESATLHIIPHLWFRNTWSWSQPKTSKPSLCKSVIHSDVQCVEVQHPSMEKYFMCCLPSPPPVDTSGYPITKENIVNQPELLFTENESNFQRLYGCINHSPYVKDGFHDHIIPSHQHLSHDMKFANSHIQDNSNTYSGDVPSSTAGKSFINPDCCGTKSAAHYVFKDIPGKGGCAIVRIRLTPLSPPGLLNLEDDKLFDAIIEERQEETAEFYNTLVVGSISDDFRQVMKQALSGMLWMKQYYRFIQKEWIEGDETQPPPPPSRKYIRNNDWKHVYIADILSVPDKWEHPYFAAWDTAFHCIPLAVIDPAFAKKQLDLLTREWYMKPDGQIPGCEWNFSDVHPPLHAWATFSVFKIEHKLAGKQDLQFLERVFQKLLLNFTWWVNRKDLDGNGVFEGGFLGFDNISGFNRSEPLPTGGILRQADATAWMAFYCVNMLEMALELAKHNPVYEDIASKFFEHFILIADAMTYKSEDGELSLWSEKDGMYYDVIEFGPGHSTPLPVRSLVGLIPLCATLVLEPAVINRFPGFKKRMERFIDNRPEVSARNTANMKACGKGERRLLALASKERLVRILEKMLNEEEFLSQYGIRSLSKFHKEQPWEMRVDDQLYKVGYCPGESDSGMFGGNSNWRGPIWLAINFLLIESLQRFHQYYGDDLLVECPTGSGEYMNLADVADEIQRRVIHIFARDADGKRATNGGNQKLDGDPHFRDYIWFHEYFHADTGKGLGASHQTGWSGLVACHILQSMTCRLPRSPRTLRSVVHHYFDETIDSHSKHGDDIHSSHSATSAANAGDLNSFGDISPKAL